MGPLRIFLPNDPLSWIAFAVFGALAIGWFFVLTDAPESIRRGLAWLRDRFR